MIVFPKPFLRKYICVMGKEERTVRMFVAVVYSLRTVTLIAYCNEKAGGRTVLAVVTFATTAQVGSIYSTTTLTSVSTWYTAALVLHASQLEFLKNSPSNRSKGRSIIAYG